MAVRQIYEAGFTALVSVIPPQGQISPRSTISDADRGKSPGRINPQGYWAGYPWQDHPTSLDDALIWEAQGANIGLRAREFPAFDVDILDAKVAGKVRDCILEHLGPTVIRHGRKPKVLLMGRTDKLMKPVRHKYEHRILGETQLVEFLADGFQYVIHGTHPTTGLPYELEDPIGAFGILGCEALPYIGPAEVERVFAAVDDLMAELGYDLIDKSTMAGASVHVDQDALNAPSGDDLIALVREIPNDIPSRDRWIEFGHAIKAASQADPGAGLEAWLEWCSRWEHGNDPDEAEHEWNKMRAPFRVGYGWLLDYARRSGIDIGSFEFGAAQEAPATHAPGDLPAEEGQGTSPEVEASREALRARGGQPAAWSESALTQTFLERHGEDYLRVQELKASEAFYAWTDSGWQQCLTMEYEVQKFLDTVASEARTLIQKAAERDKVVQRLGSRKTLVSVFNNIASRPELQISINDMDADPDIVNTPSGAYDLRTGERVPYTRDLLVSRCTRIAPDFTRMPTKWLKFIRDIVLQDSALAKYLQVSTGYWLTGRVDAQVFQFFQGRGANGKSVFMAMMMHIFGYDDGRRPGYAASASRDLVQTNKFGGKQGDPKTELARLQGTRLVTTDETETSAHWDEQIIKQITGGDTVSARFLYGKSFTYKPTFKLVVIGNYAPDLSGIGPAVQRRLQVVPWRFNAEKMAGGPNKQLLEELKAEAPAILAWIIEGAREWYRNGLPNAPVIVEETTEYLQSQDPLGEWLDEAVDFHEDHDELIPTKQLFESYQIWCNMNYHQPLRYMSFAKTVAGRIQDRGAFIARTGATRGYKGLRVAPVSEFVPDNVTPIRGKR